MDTKVLTELIDAGIYASSGDNSQPFVYEYDESAKQLDLWIDETRSGKASDKRFVLSDIALGAVIENICIKAASVGMSCDVSLFPDGVEVSPRFVARLILSDSQGKAEEQSKSNLSSYIKERCTNRNFPYKGPILAADRESLSKEAEGLGAKLDWFVDKDTRNGVMPVIRRAESIRFKSETLHGELFSTIRFGVDKVEEGMTVAALNIEKPARPFFKMMSSWPLMSFLNKLGVHNVLGFRSVSVPILLSPGVCLVSVPDLNRESIVRGGRALQRVWLKATELGMSMQPYGAPGILGTGLVDVEPELSPELDRIKKDMAKIVPDGAGLMFLRVGFCDVKPERVGRRSTESFKKVS